MSDSDRGGINKARLRRYVFGAIVSALAIIAVIGIQQWIHYDNAAARAAHDASNTDNQIAAECSVISGGYSECAREIEQASRTEQRNEYDLYSQQTMALWTAVMGSMAIIGIALSGVGVYLIWQTWDATRAAAKSSRDTLRAFIQVEKARIVLTPSGSGWRSEEKGSLTLPCNLVNFGRSAARIHAIAFRKSDEPTVPNIDTFDGYERVDLTLPADGEVPRELMVLDFPQQGYLVGHVLYDSAFGKQHRSFFGFEITYRPVPSEVLGLGNIEVKECLRFDDWPEDT